MAITVESEENPTLILKDENRLKNVQQTTMTQG